MRARELAEICEEIATALRGAPVQKVVQPERFTVALGMPRAWLLVSVDPRLVRMHLADDKPPGTGEAAPAFCMLLRKELVGARLHGCAAVEGERLGGGTFRPIAVPYRHPSMQHADSDAVAAAHLLFGHCRGHPGGAGLGHHESSDGITSRAGMSTRAPQPEIVFRSLPDAALEDAHDTGGIPVLPAAAALGAGEIV